MKTNKGFKYQILIYNESIFHQMMESSSSKKNEISKTYYLHVIKVWKYYIKNFNKSFQVD
jgi:hypothetical protein